jgi:flagellar export protein FliJ
LPRFLFNLETLLRHRESIEQKERDELFRLNYKYQTELRHHDDLVIKFRETMKELSVKQAENSYHKEFNWYYLYLHRLTHEIGESEKCLAQMQKEVQAQKEVVIEAAKKKKVLASLKEKREKEFAIKLDKQEQKEVDELVVTRYASREPEY